MKFITFLVISLTSATLWARVPATTRQFSVRLGQEVNTLLGTNKRLSATLKSLGDDAVASREDIARQLGVDVDEVSKVIELQSFDTKINALKQEMVGLTDEKIVAHYRGLLAEYDSLFDKQTSERLNTFLYALDPAYARQTEAKLYAAVLEKDYGLAFALNFDSQSIYRSLVRMLFKLHDQEYTPNWEEVELAAENGVAALYADEHVAKLWAKGDDLSEAEQEELVALLKSSDGDVALATLQSPVTTKLAKLDDRLAGYQFDGIPEKLLPAKVAEMNKLVEEINTAVERYETIRMAITYSIPQIEVTATQVLEMSKVKGLTRLHSQLQLVGTPDDIVNAYLYNRDFMHLKYVIRRANTLKEDYPPALKKILAEGDLESEVFPIYNSLVRNDYGQDITQLIAHDIIKAKTLAGISAAMSLSMVSSSDASELSHGVRDSAELFEKAGLSDERSNEIRLAHQRLKGAGKKGNQPITSIRVWANDMMAMVDSKIAKAGDEGSLLESVPTFPERKKMWEEVMKEIAEKSN